MKGVIMSRAPNARVVDIAHDIKSFDIAAGAHCLRQAAPWFPKGTIHVAVIDPGVGTKRRSVIVDSQGHLFVGPDNGLLSWVAPRPDAVYAIESPRFMANQISATFHGRDLFAVAAAVLATGAAPGDAGPKVDLAPLAPGGWVTAETNGGRGLRARIVHVDRFGNLITSCPADRIPVGARVRIPRQGRGADQIIGRISRTFGDVAPGELVAYVGSAETLEIAVREHNAARILGLTVGDAVVIMPDS